MKAPRRMPLFGALVLCAVAAIDPWNGSVDNVTSRLELLFLVAPLVVVPLALRIGSPGESGRDGSVLPGLFGYAYLPAALLIPLSFALPPGIAAALLTLPWLAVTLLLFLSGFRRLLYGGRQPIQRMAVDAGYCYIAVGGIWLAISRAGLTPMEFPPLIVLLTAVHFHYAGFTANVIAGVTGRHVRAGDPVGRSAGRPYEVAAWSIMLNPLVVAVGIAFSPLVEVVGAVLLAGGMTLFAVVTLIAVVPQMRSRVAAALAAVSSVSLFATMTLAALYAWGEFSGTVPVNIVDMARTHGIVNVVGFALCGVVGWTLEQRARNRTLTSRRK